METNEKRRDVYEIVTDRIIAQLEKGTVPWKRPWSGAGLPQNLITKRPYRGINVWLLAMLNYAQNYFLTYKQLKEIKGRVKKDEKPYLVIYWNWIDSQVEDGEVDDQKKVLMLRYYMVYNVEQCEGITDRIPPVIREAYPIPACEAVVENMPLKPLIKHKDHRAYYNPLLDFVNMPKATTFDSDEGYYGVLFHELVHSTGHLSRLNRKGLLEMTEFGSDPYSFEELVAEIGACYLESHSGIADKQFDQNAAYLEGWLQKLRGDKRLIISASTQAQKAVDFILNIKSDENRSQDIPEEIVAEQIQIEK